MLVKALSARLLYMRGIAKYSPAAAHFREKYVAWPLSLFMDSVHWRLVSLACRLAAVLAWLLTQQVCAPQPHAHCART
jgi:hypothetical protein